MDNVPGRKEFISGGTNDTSIGTVNCLDAVSKILWAIDFIPEIFDGSFNDPHCGSPVKQRDWLEK